ncbi:MAG: four helix bundle protein [Chloroflexi bacterium]|nr:four helix bundle protein [Chloroflexota bacterium]
MKVKDYRDLKVWQTGIEIVDKVYTVTDRFPKDEIYGLTGQMRRAAISIPSNIAEGFARRHSKEYKQFLYFSLGSCAELDTHLVIANRRNYVMDDKLKEMAELINHEARMLATLVSRLGRAPSD